MSTSSQAPGDSGDPDQAADGGDADAHAHIARKITAVASRIATALVECSPFVNFTASAAVIITCSNCGCPVAAATPETANLPVDHDALRHHAKGKNLALCCTCASTELARDESQRGEPNSRS